MTTTKNQRFKELKQYVQTEIEREITAFWESDNTFNKSVATREGKPNYVFYEGPPSANGMPGIHHVMARAIKDIFCRFKTLQGYKVTRKGGWDTHGLPIELSVEKTLGITKKDIGTKISVESYNKECRKEVLKFKDKWDELTKMMGYWVDLDNPYITYENEYIESVWWLLKELYNKDLLYKGLKIQPYSPAAGTGLSSHELNQPGCYRDVKDTSCVAMFKLVKSDNSKFFFKFNEENVYLLAWTTTPWTLPSNTALAVGDKIHYVKIRTFNQYTGAPISVIIAKDLYRSYFNLVGFDKNIERFRGKYPDKNLDILIAISNWINLGIPSITAEEFLFYKENQQDYIIEDTDDDGNVTNTPFSLKGTMPYVVESEFTGKDLVGLRYEQLLPFEANKKENIEGDAFRVLAGDFVTTEDGTGIVHIAPSFGADDMKVAGENGIGALTLVDRQGKFIDGVGEFSGRYVKDYTDDPKYVSVDIDICVKLKQENRAFKIEKYEHSYPHCWRTEKPVIYYPLDSWFIKVTAVKDRLIELNKTINWKPASTGTGRFGQWLENLVDWNLSRSRFWGTPLPIWRTEDGNEQICIGSLEELKSEIKRSIDAGILKSSPLDIHLDLHKPYVDEIILVSASGKAMYRESDLIDVWFDSGAMPYAQWHFPFENKEAFKNSFPADFIAEGVDQTRGWFYTLHAIAGMLFDSVAYKNVVSNGLVLDKNGNKMSKSKGNTVDPFETMHKYGADPLRWYMISNGQPWDNLKFDLDGVTETQRKLFGTLYNTYNFFAIYANVDAFSYDAQNCTAVADRPEIDRWIISKLNSLVREVTEAFEDYEPARAARAVEDFVVENLSNWHVRLSRRRFWDSEPTTDKKAAFETLYECLKVVSQLMSPVAPYFADWLYQNMVNEKESVHISYLPLADAALIDTALEQRMEYAQEISSLVLSLRKKTKIKVRQPLQKILVPAIDPEFIAQVDKIKDLVLSEVNVKEIEYISDTAGIISKKVKPNFKVLGKKLGGKMKLAADAIQQLSNEQISKLETAGNIDLELDGETFNILMEEVEVISDDIQGWLVASDGRITVALDVTISDELRREGFAREIVNRIQNERKESGFQVTDKIGIHVQNHPTLNDVFNIYKEYICNETLGEEISFQDNIAGGKEFDINGELLFMFIQKK